ncbi:MAG: DUF6263 family protein [Verrucomicrobiota bacterium]|jgi:hypothetical protein|nr:DUF6263 family protein [Verrucomicrobiota bacterium]MDG1890052.1 DUF6263 family protein [Verrucomicrobiota bacterium]
MSHDISINLTAFCMAALLLAGCSKTDSEMESRTESFLQQGENESLVQAAHEVDSQLASPVEPDALLMAPTEPQQLALSWPDGKRFIYEVVIEQVTSAGESPFAVAMNSKADQQFTYAITSRLDGATGHVQLELEFLSAKLNLDMMGNKLQYDSTLEEASKSIDPMYSMLSGLDAIMGEKLLMTLTQSGDITKMEGLKAMYQKVSASLPNQAQAIAQGIVQEDQFKQLVRYPFFPTKPVSAGTSWNQRYTQVFGISGAMEMDNTYTYKGQEQTDQKTLNVLSYEGKVMAGEEQKEEMMGMELSMMGGKNAGEIKLDTMHGYIVASEGSQEMTMRMRIPEEMSAGLPETPDINITMKQLIRLKEISDVQ